MTVGSYYYDTGAFDDSILSNLIYSNSDLGISLGDDGVTPNNSGPDGPNLYQNYPDLGVAAAFPSSFVVVGTLNAAPSTTYTIQLYGNPAADPSGYGQGQELLGTFPVTTDSSGSASLQLGLPSAPVGVQFVSATATDPNGNTSEFSADAPVVVTTSPIAAGNDFYYTDTNTTLTVPAPGVQANDVAENLQPFSSVIVTNPSEGTVTLNSDGAFTYVPNANFVGTDTFTYEDVQGSNTSNVATVTITVLPKVFVVTNTNDSGQGSLRQALFYANLSNSSGPDTIEFDIPGTGPFVISPLSGLPTVHHPTIIDGYSQPGASANTQTMGDNAVILLQIDGVYVSVRRWLHARRWRKHCQRPGGHRFQRRHLPDRHWRRRGHRRFYRHRPDGRDRRRQRRRHRDRQHREQHDRRHDPRRSQRDLFQQRRHLYHQRARRQRVVRQPDSGQLHRHRCDRTQRARQLFRHHPDGSAGHVHWRLGPGSGESALRKLLRHLCL